MKGFFAVLFTFVLVHDEKIESFQKYSKNIKIEHWNFGTEYRKHVFFLNVCYFDKYHGIVNIRANWKQTNSNYTLETNV